MITASIDKTSLKAVSKVMEDLGFNAAKEIKVALGNTAKKVKTASARKLKTELYAPTKVLKKAIVVDKKPLANDQLAVVVVMIAGYKIPLKYFGARQTKAGVAYKATSTDQGRLPSAFQIAKYDKRVYQRVGKQRGPLVQQKGPAPGEVYQSSGVVTVALNVAQEELPKQITERVRFLTLKAQGKLKGNQK